MRRTGVVFGSYKKLVMARQACLMYHGDTVDLEVVDILARVNDHLGKESESTNHYLGPLDLLLALVFPRHGEEMDENRKHRKLDGVLVRFQSALFFDVRDHIYGTMAFIDWQNKPPLRVDYSLLEAELALRLLDYWDGQSAVMWFVQVLVETLEINVNDLNQLD